MALGRLLHVMGETIKVAAALAVLLVIGAVVAGVILATKHSNANVSAITPSKYRAARFGMRESEVRRLLGKPEHTETISVQGLGTEDCWDYGVLATKSTYRFCFHAGRLVAKHRY